MTITVRGSGQVVHDGRRVRLPVLVRFDADEVIDATPGCRPARPGSVLLEVDRPYRVAPEGGVTQFWTNATLAAVGTPDEVDRVAGARAARRVSRPGCTLIPGLVNAHTHLDLTHIGPQPHDPKRGFAPWIDLIRSRRLTDPDDIADAVWAGVEASLCGGVVAVGDIAGAVAAQANLSATRALAESPLLATSFVEFFAAGTREKEGMLHLGLALAEWQRESPMGDGRTCLGIQPHAPYSVSLRCYAEVMRLAWGLGLPVCTHAAESPEERDFVARGEGPLADLLKGLGIWDADLAAAVGQGRSPVAHLEAVHGPHALTLVHLNQLSDDDIRVLVRAAARTDRRAALSAVYCPRASAYFGAHEHFGPHRYRDLLAAGVPVALGTDSIVNLPPGTQTISTWDEMVYLHARDGTDAATLLRMATTSGARAIGMPADAFTFAPGGPLAGLCAVSGSSLNEALKRSGSTPELLLLGSL